MNISLLTTRCTYFDVGGRGIKRFKTCFSSLPSQSVCEWRTRAGGKEERHEEREKKLLPLNALPSRALLLRSHVSVSGALSPPGTYYVYKTIFHKLLIKTSYFQEIVYIFAGKC